MNSFACSNICGEINLIWFKLPTPTEVFAVAGTMENTVIGLCILLCYKEVSFPVSVRKILSVFNFLWRNGWWIYLNNGSFYVFRSIIQLDCW